MKMKINRFGTTRTVFIFKNVVVKVPAFRNEWLRFLLGIIANINEAHIWKYNSGKHETGKSYLLCPVIWCSWGGWILIMKRAKTLTELEWAEGTYYNSEHRYHFPGDDSISNYGLLNKRVVKIDYGQ